MDYDDMVTKQLQYCKQKFETALKSLDELTPTCTPFIHTTTIKMHQYLLSLTDAALAEIEPEARAWGFAFVHRAMLGSTEGQIDLIEQFVLDNPQLVDEFHGFAGIDMGNPQ